MYPQSKTIIPINAVSVTNGGTASGIIDRLAYNDVMIDIIASTADVVSNSPTVVKLQEADVTNATSFARHRRFSRRYGLHDPQRQHGGDRSVAEQLQVQRRLPGSQALPAGCLHPPHDAELDRHRQSRPWRAGAGNCGKGERTGSGGGLTCSGAR